MARDTHPKNDAPEEAPEHLLVDIDDEQPADAQKTVPEPEEVSDETSERELQGQPTEVESAAEPEPDTPRSSAEVPSSSNSGGNPVVRLWRWLLTHKKLSIPVGVALLLLLLAAIPFTRFAIAATVLKQQFAVRVIDQESGKPVTSALVVAGGARAQTDSKGVATITVPVGTQAVAVTKKYYRSTSLSVTVPILKQKDTPTVRFKATGRQVPISVVNVITKKPLANVTVKAGEAEAKTDKQGKATLVVAAGKKSVDAVFSLKGYNNLTQTIPVGVQTFKEQEYKLTPSGKVYFLSNQSGKLDVVKANLDGSDRSVVVAGTGKEDRSTTSLLASRDWKYLALLARRDSDKAKLYLIDTSTDKITVMDEGDASFRLAGWSDHTFIYTVTRNLDTRVAKRQALKSFAAPTQKLTTLAETTSASPTPIGPYAYESFGDNVFILDNEVLYSKEWYGHWSYGSPDSIIAGKQATLNSIQPDGKGARVVKSYGSGAGNSYIEVSLRSYAPQEVYVLNYNSGEANMEEYEDGQIKAVAKEEVEDILEKTYPTYLLSPDGSRTFWTDYRDGKQAFFLGNAEGEDETELTALKDHAAYGWYTDDYLLLSKNGSELYVAPTGKIANEAALTLIGSYYKPDITYRGYGGGYGGL